MIGTNPKQGLLAMGQAHLKESSNALDKVVNALREDVSLYDMAVNSNDGTRIPLDQYLATIKQVTEADAFFTGAPIFDIWRTLPLGLTQYQDSIGVSPDEASRLLRRFNAYTWDEHEPKLREKYMWALGKSLWVVNRNGWEAYTGTPNLAVTLDAVTGAQEFARLKSIHDLKQATEDVTEAEKEIEKIPLERMLDFFTISDWGRMRTRERMARELEPLLKEKAGKVIEPLTRLGDEYRHVHIINYLDLI